MTNEGSLITKQAVKHNPESVIIQNTYGSGHEGATVLFPSFAINW